jgi:hypothetical protein
LQTKDEVSKKIDQIRIEALQKPSSTIPNLIFLFQGATSSEIESKTKRSLINAIPVYEKLGFKVTDALILVARDMTWLRQELDSQGCIYGALPASPGFYLPNPCKSGNGAVTSFHWEAEKFSDGLDGLYFNHVIPHEYGSGRDRHNSLRTRLGQVGIIHILILTGITIGGLIYDLT